MRQILLWVLPFLMVDVCKAEDITIRFNGSTAKVEQQTKDSVNVTVEGSHVSIESFYQAHKLSVLLTGRSDDGQLVLKTAGKAKVKLNNLNLTSQEGAPLWLKNKKKVEIIAPERTKSTLSITACDDTLNHKSAVIWAKDKILFSGKGTLDIVATGDGCRGIKCKDDITIEDITLNVTTSGNHLGEKPFSMGGFGGGPMGGMPQFHPDSIPEDVKKQFENMRKEFEERMKDGDFPMGGFGGPMGGFNGHAEGGFPAFNDSASAHFPPFRGGDAPGGMDFGKHKYVSPAKGISSKGQVIIHSGNVTVRTSTPGAEGIEGKEGVVLNGGNVDVLATDDAINANACIEFNGAQVMAISTTNDAVDANLVDFFAGGFGGFGGFGANQATQGTPPEGGVEGGSPAASDPAIIIRGGTVYAWSQRGMPEEGLDCDFSPIEISGGKVFSVGAGMGDMPSVPTQETAKQATALLIGINIAKDEPIQIYDSKGKLIDTITVPFSLNRSSSLITSPLFNMGETYTVRTKNYEKTFTLSENFVTIR